MTLQHRITTAIATKKGATQAGLARACGISRASVNAWFHGPTESIDGKYLTTAAEYLGVDPHWLATGQGEMAAHDPDKIMPLWGNEQRIRPNLINLRQVPVIGTTQGGLSDREWTDGEFPVGGFDEYAECSTADKNAFLCRVVGDSMAPRYRSGEFCLVEPNTVPEIEDDVLVRLATGETMLKRLLGVRGGLRLGSYNDDVIYTLADKELTWCYYVAHVVPPRSIKHRIEQQDYSGPDRRWVDLPGHPRRRKDDKPE